MLIVPYLAFWYLHLFSFLWVFFQFADYLVVKLKIKPKQNITGIFLLKTSTCIFVNYVLNDLKLSFTLFSVFCFLMISVGISTDNVNLLKNMAEQTLNSDSYGYIKVTCYWKGGKQSYSTNGVNIGWMKIKNKFNEHR